MTFMRLPRPSYHASRLKLCAFRTLNRVMSSAEPFVLFGFVTIFRQPTKREGQGVEDKKLILVADDDQSIRSLLQSFLETEGYRTVEAKAGRDVIPAITRNRP